MTDKRKRTSPTVNLLHCDGVGAWDHLRRMVVRCLIICCRGGRVVVAWAWCRMRSELQDET